ncbi:hypothetical protein SAMN06265784_101889 [Paraburkholderia susongensis]|uniref:Uncharacterized protein n=1 Tax=Paraburkholderia susongensis TaxID=1515439 RepID=A0A1X7INN4_9BURK|nr:hypothetical protein SAMN06265784_101889 [Paraburkholderia susongensis]
MTASLGDPGANIPDYSIDVPSNANGRQSQGFNRYTYRNAVMSTPPI